MSRRILSMNQVSIQRAYKTSDDRGLICLSAEIEFGQRGETVVYLSGKKLLGFSNSKNNIEIGYNTDLKGRELTIYSCVYDILESTNDTGIVLTLDGGKEKLTERMNFQVQSENDNVLYSLSIMFY